MFEVSNWMAKPAVISQAREGVVTASMSRADRKNREKEIRDISAYHFQRATEADIAYEGLIERHKDNASRELFAMLVERRNKHLKWCSTLNSCLS